VCCCTGRERQQQQGRAADCAVDQQIASFEAAAEPVKTSVDDWR
jgi:hypothetical protein